MEVNEFNVSDEITKAVKENFSRIIEDVAKGQLETIKMEITVDIVKGLQRFHDKISITEEDKFYVIRIPK